ncbi:MAG: site-specific integrase [Actinomycetota bacterium]
MSREGSIKRDASGHWSFVVDLSPAGSPQRRQVRRRGFKTKRDAIEKLQELQHDMRMGAFVEPSKQTLGSFLTEWLETIRSTVRQSTWASYERNMRVHVVPRIGHFPLQGIDPGTISKLYAALLADGHRGVNGYAKPQSAATNSRPTGLAPRTVAYIGTILHRAFDDAVHWGRLVRNPADAVKRPKVPHASSTVTAWDAATLADFLSRSKSYRGKGGQADRYFALWMLLATTGLRRGEALGLRWSDVDLDAKVLSVSQTVIVVEHEQMIGTPKTAAGARAVELDQVTVAAVRDHRRSQLQERLLSGAGFADHGFVFCLPDGRPYHPERVSTEFDRRVAKWGLPRITLHGLRHTWATLALRGGVHPKVVQERLGHSTISITLNTYSHVSVGMQREAAEKVASLIFGA